MIPLGLAKKLCYLIGSRPWFFNGDDLEAIDIDTPTDFEFAQFIASKDYGRSQL